MEFVPMNAGWYDMHMQAENSLWDALQNYFLLNQAVALPELLHPAQSHRSVSGLGTARGTYRDQRISPEDLWRYSAPSARSELYGTEFGTQEMSEMWERMGGILTARAQQYLDEVDAALTRSDVYPVAAMANCPFEPIYRTRRPIAMTGTTVPADNEFHWNFHQDALEFTQRFGRTGSWQECTEEGRPRHSSC